MSAVPDEFLSAHGNATGYVFLLNSPDTIHNPYSTIAKELSECANQILKFPIRIITLSNNPEGLTRSMIANMSNDDFRRRVSELTRLEHVLEYDRNEMVDINSRDKLFGVLSQESPNLTYNGKTMSDMERSAALGVLFGLSSRKLYQSFDGEEFVYDTREIFSYIHSLGAMVTGVLKTNSKTGCVVWNNDKLLDLSKSYLEKGIEILENSDDVMIRGEVSELKKYLRI